MVATVVGVGVPLLTTVVGAVITVFVVGPTIVNIINAVIVQLMIISFSYNQ